MNCYTLSLFENFKCIADKCKSSCCIGWGIDIDKNTLDFYKSYQGDFKENYVKESISIIHP